MGSEAKDRRDVPNVVLQTVLLLQRSWLLLRNEGWTKGGASKEGGNARTLQYERKNGSNIAIRA